MELGLTGFSDTDPANRLSVLAVLHKLISRVVFDRTVEAEIETDFVTIGVTEKVFAKILVPFLESFDRFLFSSRKTGELT